MPDEIEKVVTDETPTDETVEAKPVPNAEELKAKAELLEAELKEARKERDENELVSNYNRRIEKAEEKLASYKEALQPTTQQTNLDVRDLLALAKSDIEEDSKEAQILKKYKDGGLIKSYAEGFEHAGIKAEFEALRAHDTAKTVVDESDTDEYLKSKKEIVANYKANGTIPTDPKMKQAIVEENLKGMGL